MAIVSQRNNDNEKGDDGAALKADLQCVVRVALYGGGATERRFYRLAESFGHRQY
jgi:hypothetical protein